MQLTWFTKRLSINKITRMHVSVSVSTCRFSSKMLQRCRLTCVYLLQVVAAEVEHLEVFGQQELFRPEMFDAVVGQIYLHYFRGQFRWDVMKIWEKVIKKKVSCLALSRGKNMQVRESFPLFATMWARNLQKYYQNNAITSFCRKIYGSGADVQNTWELCTDWKVNQCEWEIQSVRIVYVFKMFCGLCAIL